MTHSEGLRLTLSGAPEGAAAAGQDVELDLEVTQLREAGEDLDPPRGLGRWPIRARAAAGGLEDLDPPGIDAITDETPGGHPCNEGFLLRLRHGSRLLLELELWDGQTELRPRIVHSDGWREVDGERLATFVGPPGLRLVCEGLYILID
jgi:hypothetical protein